MPLPNPVVKSTSIFAGAKGSKVKGAPQAEIVGPLQNHLPSILHLTCMMLEHGMIVGYVWTTLLIGSINMTCPLYLIGISCVQFWYVSMVTSTGKHLAMYATPPAK